MSDVVIRGPVGVVGGGVMGGGIVAALAGAGVRALVLDRTEPLAAATVTRVIERAAAAERSGRSPAGSAVAIEAFVEVAPDANALAGCDLVIEAVPEVLEVKHAVLTSLEDVLPESAVIATNTSSIPIADVARSARLPRRVVGVHFFNPADQMRLVEVTPGLRTDPAVTEGCRRFLTDVLQKQVVVAQDRAGFVVNALLVPYLVSAIRMLESGFSTATDIDTGMTAGCGHPMGPLALCDLIGLDVVHDVAETLHAEYREPHLAPPPLLRRLVAAGMLGRKSGQGFHEYPTISVRF